MNVDGDASGDGEGQNGDAAKADPVEALAEHISLYEEAEWLASPTRERWEVFVAKVRSSLV